MSLPYIGQQITIYFGCFLVIIGIIGNGINILVFSTVRTYRTSPCTFYFLIASIFNFIYITINLISRIVSVGSGFDLTRTSTSWCKIRQFCVSTLVLISLSCSCLATINQFFATSSNASFRRLSNIKWTHRTVSIIIIIYFTYGIPNLFFYEISSISNTCVNTNNLHAVVTPIAILLLVCVVPVLVMIIFGYLTYRNIHRIRVLAQQQADRQLTRMILIQVTLVIVCITPYGINNAYSLITSRISKDANRLLIENLITTLAGLGTYFYCAGSCYVFIISSSRYRQAIRSQIFFCLRWNQVIPLQ